MFSVGLTGSELSRIDHSEVQIKVGYTYTHMEGFWWDSDQTKPESWVYGLHGKRNLGSQKRNFEANQGYEGSAIEVQARWQLRFMAET